MTETGGMARTTDAGDTVPGAPVRATAAEVPGWITERLRAAGCVFAEDEAALLFGAGATGAGLQRLVAERASGRPLEYVLGWAEFRGLRIPVTDGVFVPRRRSELLGRLAVDAARAGTRQHPRKSVLVVDLCCGAGALGAAVASAVPGVRLHSADIDPAAVACAARSTAPFRGQVHTGDLFDPLPRALLGHLDVLIANAPYVPTGEIDLMPADARLYERPVALDGGDDGLSVLRRIVGEGRDWLAPAGSLLMECAGHQATVLADLVTAAGRSARIEQDDELGATVVIARRGR